MPRFYFDIVDDEHAFFDDWGVELADVVEASEQALSLLPDVAREALPIGERKDISVLVRSDAGRRCFTAALQIRTE